MARNSLDNWSQNEYAQEYRDNADKYIQDRASLLRVTASMARRFLPAQGARVLDLGCGDGVLSRVIHRALPGAVLVAADGSVDMIASARGNLAGLPVAAFHCISFQEIIAGRFSEAPFDAIVSGLAIHHLEHDQKAALFRALIGKIRPDGFFLNADVVLPESAAYEDWYYELWKEWLVERESALGAAESFAHIPERARHNEENHFDPLPGQLSALREAGFKDVDCHYRYGLFAVYGGRKP